MRRTVNVIHAFRKDFLLKTDKTNRQPRNFRAPVNLPLNHRTVNNQENIQQQIQRDTSTLRL